MGERRRRLDGPTRVRRFDIQFEMRCVRYFAGSMRASRYCQWHRVQLNANAALDAERVGNHE